jgi:hypothetical protein
MKLTQDEVEYRTGDASSHTEAEVSR